jgi:hypothetical protein
MNKGPTKADLYEWRPMYMANGLTIWAYGNQHRRYVAIRRDVDGQRISRDVPRTLLRTPELALVLTQLDIPVTCKQCLAVAKPYLQALEDLLDGHTVKQRITVEAS